MSMLFELLWRDDCDKFFLSEKGYGWAKTNIPELAALKRRTVVAHKDNYVHTCGVLGNVLASEGMYAGDDRSKLMIRLVALLHDIGKGPTAKLEGNKYTFWNHENVSAKMFVDICKRLELNLTDEEFNMVHTLIKLHGRPKTIVEDGVTDSAVRRLMREAGDHFYDLIWFCKSDATTKFADKRARYAREMDELLARAVVIAKADEEDAWRPPFTGHDIMSILGLPQSDRKTGGTVGEIKSSMIALIKDGKLAETREACLEYIENLKVGPAYANLVGYFNTAGETEVKKAWNDIKAADEPAKHDREAARKILFEELERSGWQWAIFNEETPDENNGIVECVLDAMVRFKEVGK